MAKLVFKGKEQGEFELITPGIYEFQIVKADITQDKAGEQQAHCEFEIAEGDMTGKKVPQWFGADEKRGWVLRNLLDATNTPYTVLEEGDENNAPTLDMDTDDLLQKFVRAELSHYENKNTGKTYHNLGKWEASPLQAAAEGSGQMTDKQVEQKNAAADTGTLREHGKLPPFKGEPAKTAPATTVRRGTAPRTA